MLKPRNNFVVLRLIERATKTHKTLIIPATKENYCEAEVIAVGPGVIAAEGGRADTYDLKVGQLVFLQHKKEVQRGVFVYAGIPYRTEDKSYFVYDQSSIVGIVAESAAGAGAEYTEVRDGPGLAVPNRELKLAN